MTTTAAPNQYHDGLNLKLLDAVPPQARKVLELGCANGRLGGQFKTMYPSAKWHGVERSPQAAAEASKHLDQVHVLDLDQDDLDVLGTGFDVIVIGDLLEHLTRPARILTLLQELSADDATLVCCLPNMGHRSVIERLLTGDMTYDQMGLLDETHVRFYTLASASKLFLDCGWLPNLRDQYRVEPADDPLGKALLAATQALGVPENTARRQFGQYQMILSARKRAIQVSEQASDSVPFSVVVPVNRPWQYELNIARSPGLKEVGAEIIPIQGASSAAEAYRIGAARASHPWVLLVHQDVYFPVGSGRAISRHLGSLHRQNREYVPVGFAGIACSEDGNSLRQAGLLIDRGVCFDHGSSQRAVSLDELAIALHRDSPIQPDPALPWHLWATDLCLQAEAIVGEPVAEVVQVPLFHNSLNDYQLPAAFHEAAAVLLAKHGIQRRITTLCGIIDSDFLTTHGIAQRAAQAVAPANVPCTNIEAAIQPVTTSPIHREAALSLHLPAAEAQIERLMDAGDAAASTERLISEVHDLCTRGGNPGGGLHLPGLDRHIERLAAAVAHDADQAAMQRRDGGSMIFASELYDLTGHTRLLHEMAFAEDRPMLILTDLFGTYARQPERVEELKHRFAHLDLVVLPKDTAWQKCLMVKRAAEAVRPARIIYFAHHQDPIPYIGTVGLKGPTKIFVHHGNQHPSLGCTLTDVVHLDVDDSSRLRCSGSLTQTPQKLELPRRQTLARVA